MQRTYHDYYTTSTNLAGALKYDFGINDLTSTVALFCPNHVDYLPIMLAVSLCGAKVTPINPMYTRLELATVLKQSRSTVLIAHVSTLDVALETIKNNHTPVQHVIVVTDTMDIDGGPTPTVDTAENTYISDNVPFGTVRLDALRRHGRAFDKTVGSVCKNPAASPVILPYSSGTTGLPKGVCLSHYNIVSNLLQIERVEGESIQPWHSIFTPLPFYHIYALTVSLLFSTWQGLTLYTMSKKFDLKTFCDLIQVHTPERCHLVPPILLRIANDPIVEKYDLSSIETIICAAAPLSRDIEVAVERRIGGECRVKQAWGMSELSPIGTINADKAIKSGSIGPLISSTIGKILDTSGNSLPANQVGELVIQGPQVMMGYMDNPDQTRDCISEQGWLRTGDVAYYDDDGYFYITDRIKELIKVRGHQVAPAELEAIILTHPDVVDAAVIGIQDDYSGELPRAYIVRRVKPTHHVKEHEDSNLNTEAKRDVTESDIYEWVKERIAGYKRLDGGIIFLDAIPKSASGKILRRVLREQASKEKSD
jgi:4-coumarate--CoA ligase